MTSGDNPSYSNGETDQSTEKSPGDLRRLVVTQTPVKNNLLTLMWKDLLDSALGTFYLSLEKRLDK